MRAKNTLYIYSVTFILNILILVNSDLKEKSMCAKVLTISTRNI